MFGIKGSQNSLQSDVSTPTKPHEPYIMPVSEAARLNFIHPSKLRPINDRTPAKVIEFNDLYQQRAKSDAKVWDDALNALEPALRDTLQSVTKELAETQYQLATLDGEIEQRNDANRRPGLINNLKQWVQRGSDLNGERVHLVMLITALEAKQNDLLSTAHDALFRYAQKQIKEALQYEDDCIKESRRLKDEARNVRRQGSENLSAVQRFRALLDRGSGVLKGRFE